MARATWNGAVLAESDDVEIVEGNVYFPAGAVDRAHLRESAHHTVCGWKGVASYYDVVVGGGERERRLVLPEHERRREEHRRLRRVLARRARRALISARRRRAPRRASS
jgi:uncharacterized protein (DUF427 family)